MKTVELSLKQFKTIPGYTTTRSVSRWKGDIDALLYEIDSLENLEIIKKGWIYDRGMEFLALEMEVTIGNVSRTVQFRLEPVMIRVKKKNRQREWVVEKKPETSWKLFHDLLERKIAAVRVGVTELHHEFMPYIAKQLPDGSIGTFADFMDMILVKDQLTTLGLEDKSNSKRIEVESQVVT